ncbi:MAG: hypothetical protein IJ492_02425 [Clostridia bacterium]|nr:hypothetical protein [Clostridia bacterium]MBQ8505099.1 hypothetical protein [Clostridia bacterium]MBQ8772141.1 hypothetical protein [Clostridia bacterium]MBQ8872725.1 hypothetical protein [Clostridia bacterium]MBQ9707098.1 hypothetical protein [Clostridia bacterium]
MLNNDKKQMKLDRMRYTKNAMSSNMALLAIVANVVYFVVMYKINNKAMYELMMGASVITNLLFMLTVFLCSEGVKKYNIKYAAAMIVIGAIELVRIFIWPLKLHNTETKITVPGQEPIMTTVLNDGQFVLVIVLLVCAAALLIAGGIIGVIRGKQLAAYNESLKQAEQN